MLEGRNEGFFSSFFFTTLERGGLRTYNGWDTSTRGEDQLISGRRGMCSTEASVKTKR